MPTITLTDPVAGTVAASGLIATNNANLRTLLNSGLDGTNLKGNPSLAAGDVPVWNGTQFVATPFSTSGWTSVAATLTYSSTDGHTFVVTTGGVDLTAVISLGSRIKLTHSAALKYFIVTAIDATTITLYGGTDYTLAATAITVPYYSVAKAPLGFPLNPAKWTEELNDTSDRAQATPTNSVWYNLGSLSLSIPIGVWSVEYEANCFASATSGTVADMSVTLSTANNSQSDSDFTSRGQTNNTGVTNPAIRYSAYRRKVLALTSKTPYYLNAMSPNGQAAINFMGSSSGATFIRAICAYL